MLKYEHQAYSLFLADHVLRFGYSPQALCKELGLDLPTGLRKYSPAQPRDNHGQWTSDGGGSETEPEPALKEGRSASSEDEKEYEERRRLGRTTPKEDIQHERPPHVPLPDTVA
jgi:hypothetical protein